MAEQSTSRWHHLLRGLQCYLSQSSHKAGPTACGAACYAVLHRLHRGAAGDVCGVAGPQSYRTTASRAIIMGILMGCISGAVVSTRLQAAPDNVIVMANAADRAASGGAAQEFDGTDEEDGKSKQGKATADASRATDNVSVSIELAEARFKPLMVVTACVVAFAHGSNDVSNSIGPFNALVEIYNHGTIRPGAAVPLWVLICGGVGIGTHMEPL